MDGLICPKCLCPVEYCTCHETIYQEKIERLHNWSLNKIRSLYNPRGNRGAYIYWEEKGWLTAHLLLLIKEAFKLGKKLGKIEGRLEELNCVRKILGSVYYQERKMELLKLLKKEGKDDLSSNKKQERYSK